MGEFPGLYVEVTHNGVDVSDHVVVASSTLDKAKLTRSWELEFDTPMIFEKSDLVTIKRKIAGHESVWCEDAPLATISGNLGIDSDSGNALKLVSSRRISGDGQSESLSDLLSYCVPKTLVFVNADWLASLYPTAVLVDGVLTYGGVGEFGLDSARIYDPRLPGVEFESDSFECIVGVQTHHDIAKHLAQLVGCDVQITTPNLPIIDTHIVASGTTWLSAITDMFRTLWFPTVECTDVTIFISDILADGNTEVPTVQPIEISYKALKNASLNKSVTGRQTPIDHLIVTGRRTTDTTILQPGTPDYTVVDVPEIEVTADLDIEVSRTLSDKLQYKQMGTYSGDFGMPGEEVTPNGVKSITHTIHYYVDEQNGRRNYVQVGETINSYDYSDVEVARKIIEYKYGKGYVPTRTIEKNYAYFNLPGTSEKALHLVTCKTTIQRYCKKPLNLSLTEEIIEGLVLYEKIEVDEVEYKVFPIILGDVLRADTSQSIIETDEDTTQDTLEMTLSEKTTAIFRTHDEVLIKHEQTHDELTNYTRHNSQILDNPLRDRNKVKEDHIFRKEYFDGSGKTIGGYGPCYHPPKTINHEDICTEEISDKVAARAFAKKNVDANDEYILTLPFPFPIETLGVQVTLPDFSTRVSGDLVVLPGGDYVLQKATERVTRSVEGNVVKLKPETILTVRARY